MHTPVASAIASPAPASGTVGRASAASGVSRHAPSRRRSRSTTEPISRLRPSTCPRLSSPYVHTPAARRALPSAEPSIALNSSSISAHPGGRAGPECAGAGRLLVPQAPGQAPSTLRRIDVEVRALIRDAARLDLESGRVVVAHAADRHVRSDGDGLVIEPGPRRARSGRQREVPYLAVGIADLHRRVGTAQVDRRDHRTGQLDRLIVAAPAVVSGSRHRRERERGAAEREREVQFQHDRTLPSLSGAAAARRTALANESLPGTARPAQRGRSRAFAALLLSQRQTFRFSCNFLKIHIYPPSLKTRSAIVA